ncbi:hypothetical protein [Sphingomonas sp. OTU376]|uniref:hypothetical protein n=1 Tax=Sphingomonas sp. OTU376 TaxID=3043863 RepID=UPI00313E38CE
MGIDNDHRRAFNGGTFYAQMTERPLERLIKNRPVVIDQGRANPNPMLGQLVEQPRPNTEQFAVYGEWSDPEAITDAGL